jgi:hypothetical protein
MWITWSARASFGGAAGGDAGEELMKTKGKIPGVKHEPFRVGEFLRRAWTPRDVRGFERRGFFPTDYAEVIRLVAHPDGCARVYKSDGTYASQRFGMLRECYVRISEEEAMKDPAWVARLVADRVEGKTDHSWDASLEAQTRYEEELRRGGGHRIGG